MCTGAEIAPLLITAAATTAGSAVERSAANKRAKAEAEASNAELQQYKERNDARSEEARAEYEKRLSRSEDQTLEQDAAPAAQERTALIERIMPKGDAVPSLKGSAPRAVASEFETATADARDGVARERAAKAAADSFADALFDRNIDTARAGTRIGMIGGLDADDQRSLVTEQELARIGQGGVGSGGVALGQGIGALGTAGALAAGAYGPGGAPAAKVPKKPVVMPGIGGGR